MSRIGDEVGDIRVYETLDLGENPKYEETIKAFGEYMKLNKNPLFIRHQFLTYKYKTNQSFDSFVLELRRKADKYDFIKALLLRDMVVIGILDE